MNSGTTNSLAAMSTKMPPTPVSTLPKPIDELPDPVTPHNIEGAAPMMWSPPHAAAAAGLSSRPSPPCPVQGGMSMWGGVPTMSLTPPVPAVYPSRGPDPLDVRAHTAIAAAFTRHVPEIFGANLVYAFICGSVARGHAIRGDATTPGDDIDTFVVLHVRSAEQVAHYTRWLEALHLGTGLTVDHDYPHEIVTLGQLDGEVWPRLASTHLDLHYNGSRVFDTVTWAEMVASDKAGVVGNVDRLAGDIVRVESHVARWREEILTALAREGDQAETALAYRRGQASGTSPADFQGGLESWHQMQKFSLPRLMRRVVPLPDAPPPAGTSAIREALMALPVLRGQQVVLRPLETAHVPALFDMCTRPEVAEHCSWEVHRHIDTTRAFVAGEIGRRQAGEPSAWAITRADDPDARLVGTCGLIDVNEADENAELGIALHPDFQRRGIGTEAMQLTLRFCRHTLGLHKVRADCVPDNLASRRLLEKVGLQQEAELDDEVKKNNVFHKILRFAQVFGRPST